MPNKRTGIVLGILLFKLKNVILDLIIRRQATNILKKPEGYQCRSPKIKEEIMYDN